MFEGRNPTDITVDVLVTRARQGDQAAWNALVRRYLPLVLAVTRAYRLRETDAEDVCQIVWLRLVEHLGRIRDPRAVPKWIVTTARHECQRLARGLARTVLVDPLDYEPQPDQADLDAGLLRAEQRQALRDGLAVLPTVHREMLLLLAADPPLSYRDISEVLGIPIGSIGPTRARCLRRLRASAALHPYATAVLPARKAS
jgi:RNA polymerase sigma factor (sigma-70 family)